MDKNRKAAFNVLLDVEKNDSYVNLVLNQVLSDENPPSQGFVRELVYGVMENKLLLDYYIDNFVKKGIKSLKKQDLTLLRMGIYQIEYMNSVPAYAAVNETVKMARKLARGRDGFINGVLRSYLSKKEQVALPSFEENPSMHLSIKYSCHKSICDLWISQFGIDKTISLLEWTNKVPPVNVRTNSELCDRDELAKSLETQGFEVEYEELSSRSLRVKGEKLLETDLYREGYFSVQDVASTFIADSMSPVSGDVILDMCSAPGGKTLAMAEELKGKGKIIACDIYPHRLGLIEKEMKRLKISNVETAIMDGTLYNEDFEASFDKVLVDGPCSGLGVLRRKPELKYREVVDSGKELASIQLKILQNGSKYVKPGGKLCYSTCTINKFENEGVAEKFLQENNEFVVKEMRQLSPIEDGCDGFFVALFERRI